MAVLLVTGSFVISAQKKQNSSPGTLQGAIVATPSSLTVDVNVDDETAQTREVSITNGGSEALEVYLTVRKKAGEPMLNVPSVNTLKRTIQAGVKPFQRPMRRVLSAQQRGQIIGASEPPYNIHGTRLFASIVDNDSRGKIIELNPTDLNIVNQFPAGAMDYAAGTAFDGEYIYVSDGFIGAEIRKYNPDTGQLIDSYSNPNEAVFGGLASDGEYLYASEINLTKRLYKIDFDGKRVVNTIPLDFYPGEGLAHAGNTGTLYINSLEGYKIYELDASTGEIVNTMTFDETHYFMSLAYSSSANVLFAYEYNRAVLMALDPKTGDVLHEMPYTNDDAGLIGLASDETYQPVVLDFSTKTVQPGETITVTVEFSSRGMLGKTYHYELLVNSNNGTTPQVIPVTLNVVGAPPVFHKDLSVMDFGELLVSQERKLKLRVSNLSVRGILQIKNIAINNPQFTVDKTSMRLYPEADNFIEVAFSPVTEGNHELVLQFETNDPNAPLVEIPVRAIGMLPPVMQIDQPRISISLAPGQIQTVSLSISNAGRSLLRWNLESEMEDTSLPAILKRLNEGSARLTDKIPSRYDFFGGRTGSGITGAHEPDMYHEGNKIEARNGFSSRILPYTDGAIQILEYLSPNAMVEGKYFTAKHNGLFTFVADTDLTSFKIVGELSGGKHPNLDGAEISTTRLGIPLKGLIKRSYGPHAPSINHMFIAHNRRHAIHEIFSNSKDLDSHEMQSPGNEVTSLHRVYYLMFSGLPGTFINNSAMEVIMNEFLNTIAYPDWLKIMTATSGETEPQAQDNIQLKINTTGLSPGEYETVLYFNGNDPGRREIQVPVRLTVETIVNRRPVVTNPISDRSVLANEEISLDLSKHFVDPDGDMLSYTATTPTPENVLLRVEGNFLYIKGKALSGNASIQIVAKDPSTLSVTSQFNLRTGIVTGVHEGTKSFSFSPNPFKETIEFSISLSEDSSVRITIVDQLGRMIGVPVDGTYHSGRVNLPLNFTSSPNGIYYYKLQIGQELYSGKILKTD